MRKCICVHLCVYVSNANVGIGACMRIHICACVCVHKCAFLFMRVIKFVNVHA